MHDVLLRTVSHELNLRAACVRTVAVCEEARRCHGTSPLATIALGRALNCALLMSTLVKGRHKVALQYCGDGPLREIYADADGLGHVRGYVRHPDVTGQFVDGRPDVGVALGKGVLSVTTDLGVRDRYQGIVPLQSGEVGPDFGYYLATSMQIPSIVNVGTFVDASGGVVAAGGFLVQCLPGAGQEQLAEIEGNILGLPPLAGLLGVEQEPARLLAQIFHGYRYELFAPEPVWYACPCNRARVERTLIALGTAEIRAMIAEDGGADVRCEFCGRHYRLSARDLEELLQRSEGVTSA